MLLLIMLFLRNQILVKVQPESSEQLRALYSNSEFTLTATEQK